MTSSTTDFCAHCYRHFDQCTCEVEEVPLKYYQIELTFTDWMGAINNLLANEFGGLATDDLPDQPYYDWYSDGIEPAQAAKDAVRGSDVWLGFIDEDDDDDFIPF